MSEEEVVGEGWCTTILPSDSRSCLTVTEILWKSQQMSTPASGSGWGHWGRLHEFRKCSMYSCFGLSLFLRSAVHSNMVKTPRRDTCSCLTFFLCFQNVFVHPYSIFQTMCPESWNWCKRLRSVFCLFVFLMKWNTQWNRNSHSVSLSVGAASDWWNFCFSHVRQEQGHREGGDGKRCITRTLGLKCWRCNARSYVVSTV